MITPIRCISTLWGSVDAVGLFKWGRGAYFGTEMMCFNRSSGAQPQIII